MLTPDMLDAPVSMGTTLIAVRFKDGVVIAADSRTSTGSYVANRVTDKLTPITKHIFCCRSGSAADTQTLAEIVRYQLDFYEREMGEPATVETAANMFRSLCYEYRDKMVAGIICAGWDRRRGGQVYSVSAGGSIVSQDIALGGSGSVFVTGFADALFRRDMTKEDAVKFCLQAVALAIKRDGSSGGVCRLATIGKDGVEKTMVSHEQLPQF